MIRVLRVPVFPRLLAAYTLNELAWSVGTLALAVLVYRRTGSAFGSAAFFISAQVLPAFVSPTLVAQLDQRPSRRVLPALYAVEAALFAALAVMTSNFALVPVLAIALADGVVAAAARALARAATADVLIPADLLEEGNALTNALFSVCLMVGPALGGLVVAAGGTVAALLANCGLLAIIAVVLLTSGLTGPERRVTSTKRRLRSALAYVRIDVPVRTLMSLQAVGAVFFTISVPVEVVFAERTLHAGAGGYGALISAWGAGAVLGSAVYARLRRSSARLLITAGTGVLACGFALMAAAPTIEVALVGAALGGFANGLELIAAKTAMQQRTAAQWMAMVMSLNESVSMATPGLGFLLGGAITTLANPRVALAVAAAGSLAITALSWIVLGPGRMAPRSRGLGTPDAAPAGAPPAGAAIAEGAPGSVRPDSGGVSNSASNSISNSNSHSTEGLRTFV